MAIVPIDPRSIIAGSLSAPAGGASAPNPRTRVKMAYPGPGESPLPLTTEAAASRQVPDPDTVPHYEVGYKKPPARTRFRAGQSGNPMGRPRGSKGLKTLIRESLSQKVLARTASGEKKISRIEGVIHKTIELAMKGNARALTQLLGLYAAAVPDAPEVSTSSTPEDLSATDQTILASYLADLRGQDDGQ